VNPAAPWPSPFQNEIVKVIFPPGVGVMGGEIAGESGSRDGIFFGVHAAAAEVAIKDGLNGII
jgi:hypothetical protein